ncbi:hypothetical protein DL93DRAFT_2052864, partial [Clavulina sp. PMI_390]
HTACSLHGCLNKNTYKPERCDDYLKRLYVCCQNFYENRGDKAETPSCPMPSVVTRWMKKNAPEKLE